MHLQFDRQRHAAFECRQSLAAQYELQAGVKSVHAGNRLCDRGPDLEIALAHDLVLSQSGRKQQQRNEHSGDARQSLEVANC